jgi:hypothetical protein
MKHYIIIILFLLLLEAYNIGSLTQNLGDMKIEWCTKGCLFGIIICADYNLKQTPPKCNCKRKNNKPEHNG